jgi:hypothetical protein
MSHSLLTRLLARPTVSAFIIVTVGIGFITPGVSHATNPKACLGTDPTVAGDLLQIAAARNLIDTTACPPTYFDGTVPARAHSAYFACAANIIQNAVITGKLRKQCVTVIRKIYKVSTPGTPVPFAGNLPVPCITKSANGNVSCRLSKDCPGGVSCPNSLNCLDAADTNYNGKLDKGDTGGCNAPIVCGNGVREGSEMCDAPGTTCPAGQGCTFSTCQCVPCGACDGRQCRLAGTCDTSGQCGSIEPDETQCDDGNATTSFDTCVSGVCVGATCPCEGFSRAPEWGHNLSWTSAFPTQTCDAKDITYPSGSRVRDISLSSDPALPCLSGSGSTFKTFLEAELEPFNVCYILTEMDNFQTDVRTCGTFPPPPEYPHEEGGEIVCPANVATLSFPSCLISRAEALACYHSIQAIVSAQGRSPCGDVGLR